ncbi:MULTISPECIES: hypothetical protein [unclassified Streptomyces]|uniref:hypothetical protein n=1 Tax=unclassified Streptomyces TaxID=2593676 RepID=UPI002B1CD8C2|nr:MULTISPECIES: hypothetical protein [unclassified Streptomyces]
MKHPDDDNELFNRLEAEMTDPDAPSGGEVVDLGKARTARGESPDPTPDPSADSRPPKSADQEPTESADARPTLVDQKVPTVSGPGVIDRIKHSKRLDVFPAWLKSRAEFKEALGWLAGHAWHTVAFHTVRVPFVYLPKLIWRARAGRSTPWARWGVGPWTAKARLCASTRRPMSR